MSEDKNLDWIYSTESKEELERRYDEWSGDYDRTLADWGWRGPQYTVANFEKYVPTQSRVLDVGAGTGLVGELLAQRGYSDVSALDLSAGMLEVARSKNVYRAFYRMALGSPLDFEDDCFTGLIAVGVFTLGHAPASAFDELTRITAPGGHVAVLIRPDVYEEHGFREKFARLEADGVWREVEKSASLQTLPNEPSAAEQYVYVFRVH